jgi:alkanesulfonate monooxygenase SsuD/methylene tetrahydromethanopterin reductase-like flavin-dependent oxidoreductase (luciferase family)
MQFGFSLSNNQGIDADRGASTDEAIALIQALWTEGPYSPGHRWRQPGGEHLSARTNMKLTLKV